MVRCSRNAARTSRAARRPEGRGHSPSSPTAPAIHSNAQRSQADVNRAVGSEPETRIGHRPESSRIDHVDLVDREIGVGRGAEQFAGGGCFPIPSQAVSRSLTLGFHSDGSDRYPLRSNPARERLRKPPVSGMPGTNAGYLVRRGRNAARTSRSAKGKGSALLPGYLPSCLCPGEIRSRTGNLSLYLMAVAHRPRMSCRYLAKLPLVVRRHIGGSRTTHLQVSCARSNQTYRLPH